VAVTVLATVACCYYYLLHRRRQNRTWIQKKQWAKEQL